MSIDLPQATVALRAPVSALEQMRGRLAAATVEGSLRIQPVAVGDGRVRLELPLSAPMLDGSPRASAALDAALAVLCDCGLGLAMMEGRGDGDGGITLDLRVDLLRPLAPATRVLTLVSRALHVSGQHGAARADVHDERGRTVAQAVGTLAVSASLPIHDRDPVDPDHPPLDLVTVFDGLEADGAHVRIPIRPETENTRGIVHGALLTAAGLAAVRAVRPEPERRPLWFAAEFLRPVPALVGALHARVHPVRSGRRFVSDRIELALPDGRPAAVVTVSSSVITPSKDALSIR